MSALDRNQILQEAINGLTPGQVRNLIALCRAQYLDGKKEYVLETTTEFQEALLKALGAI